MVDARGGSMKGCRYSGVKVSFAGLFIIINTKTFLVTMYFTNMHFEGVQVVIVGTLFPSLKYLGTFMIILTTKEGKYFLFLLTCTCFILFSK